MEWHGRGWKAGDLQAARRHLGAQLGVARVQMRAALAQQHLVAA